jgi:hypothetical protein
MTSKLFFSEFSFKWAPYSSSGVIRIPMREISTIYIINQCVSTLWMSRETDTIHCYKTFRRIPPPSLDDARLILLYRGKRLLYMGREFAPSGTEVLRNHWKFPAIFTMKKGRRRTMGSNSVPLEYYSCPLPLDHGYHIICEKIYTNKYKISTRIKKE